MLLLNWRLILKKRRSWDQGGYWSVSQASVFHWWARQQCSRGSSAAVCLSVIRDFFSSLCQCIVCAFDHRIADWQSVCFFWRSWRVALTWQRVWTASQRAKRLFWRRWRIVFTWQRVWSQRVVARHMKRVNLSLSLSLDNQLLIISWYCRWQTEDDYHYRRSLRAPANDWETFKSKWSWQHGETSFKIRLLRKDRSRCLPWLFLGSCRPKTNDSLVYNKSKWQNRSNHGPKDWHNDTNQSQVRTNHVRCFCSMWPRIKVVPAGTAGFIAESNSFRLASKHTGVANLFKLRPLRKGRGPSPIFNRSFST